MEERKLRFHIDGDMQNYCVKLMDLMGKEAQRRQNFFEGGCSCHFCLID